MKRYRIAWLPGDGVGGEVLDCAKIVLDRLELPADYIPGDIGWEFWRHEGDALPSRTIGMLRTTDCALFGAITSKPKDKALQELDPDLQDQGLEYFSPIVRLRQLFNLHTNIRPCKAYPGNPLNLKENINLVIFRENTEGMYGGVEFHPLPEEVFTVLDKHHPKMHRFKQFGLENLALSTRIMSRQGCTNIVTQAFKYAQQYGYPTVTVVDKPNVLRETGGLMIESARKVAQQFPGIELWETNIDAMCMWLVKNPEDYGIIVAENMFGDILSDLAAQLIGGLGFACSANIGDSFAVFEPTHGSAPKYVGQHKVNPIATILTVKMMLDWLGETDKAQALEQAVAAVIREQHVGTYDIGLSNTNLEVAEEIARKLRTFLS